MLEIQVDIVSDKKKLDDDFAIKLDVITVVARDGRSSCVT